MSRRRPSITKPLPLLLYCRLRCQGCRQAGQRAGQEPKLNVAASHARSRGCARTPDKCNSSTAACQQAGSSPAPPICLVAKCSSTQQALHSTLTPAATPTGGKHAGGSAAGAAHQRKVWLAVHRKHLHHRLHQSVICPAVAARAGLVSGAQRGQRIRTVGRHKRICWRRHGCGCGCGGRRAAVARPPLLAPLFGRLLAAARLRGSALLGADGRLVGGRAAAAAAGASAAGLRGSGGDRRGRRLRLQRRSRAVIRLVRKRCTGSPARRAATGARSLGAAAADGPEGRAAHLFRLRCRRLGTLLGLWRHRSAVGSCLRSEASGREGSRWIWR